MKFRGHKSSRERMRCNSSGQRLVPLYSTDHGIFREDVRPHGIPEVMAGDPVAQGESPSGETNREASLGVSPSKEGLVSMRRLVSLPRKEIRRWTLPARVSGPASRIIVVAQLQPNAATTGVLFTDLCR